MKGRETGERGGVKYDRSVNDDEQTERYSIPTITFTYPASLPQRRPDGRRTQSMMMIAMITQSHNDDYGGTGVMTISGDSLTMIDGEGGVR